MEMLDIIRMRRSVRSHSNRPIAEDDLRKLVEVANWAPSASNKFPWGIVIIQQRERIKKIQTVSPGMLGSPTAIMVLCANRDKAFKGGGKSGRDLFCIMDIAHAAQNICLVATELGIGSCCIMSFSPAAVAELLNLPENTTADYLISLGYAKGPIKTPKRRPLDEAIISWIKE